MLHLLLSKKIVLQNVSVFHFLVTFHTLNFICLPSNAVSEEIEERKVWLEEMKSLGRGKEFESIILQEISVRLAEMRQIDKTFNPRTITTTTTAAAADNEQEETQTQQNFEPRAYSPQFEQNYNNDEYQEDLEEVSSQFSQSL